MPVFAIGAENFFGKNTADHMQFVASNVTGGIVPSSSLQISSPQNLRKCRQHGTWPGFWQLASVHGPLLCGACSSQLDTSSTLSAISSIAMTCRNDWNSRCTSLYRGNACNALGTREHRMFLFAMVTLLVPTASCVQGQVE